jgi:hypothetical protein
MRDGFLKFKRDQGGEMRKFSASLERLGENIYEQPFTITDVFGNEEYVWKSLYVHGKPPRIKVDDGSCGKTVQACGARIVIEDASGIGTLEVTGPGIDNGSNLVESILEGSDPSPLLRVLARDPENGKGPLLSATLKLEHGIPGTQKFTVTAADCTSSNAAGEKNTCEVTFECSLPSSPPEVEWRNLPWRRVGDGDRAFYISKWEIPVWFWDAPGSQPPADTDENKSKWLPKTRVSPEDITKWLNDKKDDLGDTYLPTYEEWGMVSSSSEKTTWVKEGQPKTDHLEELGQLVNCYYKEEQIPACIKEERTERSLISVKQEVCALNGDSGTKDYFYETIHFLGNVEEIVVEDSGEEEKHKSVGGSVDLGLNHCIEQKFREEVKVTESRDHLGFRLVVYHRSPAEKKRKRKRNQKFADALVEIKK